MGLITAKAYDVFSLILFLFLAPVCLNIVMLLLFIIIIFFFSLYDCLLDYFKYCFILNDILQHLNDFLLQILPCLRQEHHPSTDQELDREIHEHPEILMNYF